MLREKLARKTTENELNETTTEYCKLDVAFRPRKRRRKFTFISPLFGLLLFLLIAQIAFVKGAAFASGEDDDAWRRRKLESDVVDARRRTRTTTANDESGRLTKSARELAFEAHAKRQARTNEKMRETMGARRRLVFQRDVVAVSVSDDEGAFARKKAELFKTTKTKSSKSTRDGTDGVDDQTATTTNGEEGEDESLSRERLLRRREVPLHYVLRGCARVCSCFSSSTSS